MYVFVWFCATCLWLNISGVPDCLYLCGMYSEFKGFVVGRAISRAEEEQQTMSGGGEKKWAEEEFWYSQDKKMETVWNDCT